MALHSPNGLLDIEDISIRACQQGSACVQNGRAATLTSHHFIIDGDPGRLSIAATQYQPVSCPLPLGPSHPRQDPQGRKEVQVPFLPLLGTPKIFQI